MLKVELHTHTWDDPVDRIPHGPMDLIDRAASVGYHALALTLHNKQLDIRPLAGYAKERGVVLIPGIERTIERRHVLLLNFATGAEDVRSFEDLARLKRRTAGQPALIVAPHPYFPLPSCLWGKLDRHADLFDAVEINAMFTTSIDFNRRADRFAAQYGKPRVGNGDVHRLRQLGSTYSLVDAPPDADAICDAIARGRVQVVRKPLTGIETAAIVASMLLADLRRRGPVGDPRGVAPRVDQPAA